MAPYDRTIGQLVGDAVEDVRAIIQHEKALAKAEITRAAKAGGVGAGLLAAALGLLSLATIYLLIAAAEALIEAGMTRWGGFLVVGGALVLLAILLALIGVVMIKRVSGPDKTLSQGKGTVQDVKAAFASVEDDSGKDAAMQTAKLTTTAVLGGRGTGKRD